MTVTRCFRRSIALAAAGGAVSMATPPVIDGRNIPAEFGAAVATQRFQTHFADHTDGSQFGEGSELDQLFITNDAERLYIGVTGNLKNDGNAIMIFLDTTGVGSGVAMLDVKDDFGDPVPGLRDTRAPGPNVYGTPRYLAGGFGSGWHNIGFDDGFRPDFILGFSGGSPLGSQVRTYYLVNWTTLDPAGGENHSNQVAGMMTAGNETASGPAGTLGSFLQTANLNVLGAGDNSGVAGVEGGNGLATQDPASQTTGFEFAIPLSLMDVQIGETVCVFAALTNSDGYLSNQFLPTDSEATSLSNIGNESVTPRPYSFASMPGPQFVCYTLTGGGCPLPGCDSGGIDADLNNDCQISLNDLTLLLANFGCTGTCTGDVDNNGAVDLTDLTQLLSRFGNVCQ